MCTQAFGVDTSPAACAGPDAGKVKPTSKPPLNAADDWMKRRRETPVLEVVWLI
jgi:hypothetical protein